MVGISEHLFVITGAAKGIGEAIARRLAEERARVIISDVDEEAGIQTANAFQSLGGEAHFRKLDVADRHQVSSFAESITAEFGPVYGLVNNAAVAITHNAFDCTDEVWEKTIQINLDGVFYCCREFGRGMRAQGDSIVNISSIAGVKVVRPETHVAYGATKAAVAHMTSLLGVEWAAYGIRVNAVAPGYTETSILSGMKVSSPDVLKAWIQDIPIKRLILPKEIANVVVFRGG
jgi:NAD(P)-dependent dehydrogenase (short-subunit alcohol dehydrogenase family)